MVVWLGKVRCQRPYQGNIHLYLCHPIAMDYSALKTCLFASQVSKTFFLFSSFSFLTLPIIIHEMAYMSCDTSFFSLFPPSRLISGSHSMTRRTRECTKEYKTPHFPRYRACMYTHLCLLLRNRSKLKTSECLCISPQGGTA